MYRERGLIMLKSLAIVSTVIASTAAVIGIVALAKGVINEMKYEDTYPQYDDRNVPEWNYKDYC